MPQAELETMISKIGLTMTAEFVPFSKSRNAKLNPKLNERSLNWRITLDIPESSNAVRKVIETDYQAGIAHCPSYKPGRITLHIAEAVEYETENGRQSLGSSFVFGGKPIQPKIADIVYSLISDSSAIDELNFEDWATSLGYNPDSHSAEKIYQGCIKTGLILRNTLGETKFRELQRAAQDY